MALYCDKNIILNFIPGTETQTQLQLLRQNICSQILLDINKQNNSHRTLPQTHIAFILPCPKGIGSRHRIGTGNNRGRKQTTPCDNRCFNSKDSHSKRNAFSLSVIPVLPPLNDSVIIPPQLSSVCQQSYTSAQKKTLDSQAYSIHGGTSSDPSNTVPPPSTKSGSPNVYGCMLDVSKTKPSQ